jgi:hypothetical protein
MTRIDTNYQCIPCGFSNKNRGLYTKHLETKKHAAKMEKQKGGCDGNHLCDGCGKTFQHRQSLSRHRKGCCSLEYSQEITPNIIMSLMKQNEELKTMLIEERKIMEMKIQSSQELLIQQHKELVEYCKQPKIVKETRNQYNLNFFLNEKCKDAINLSEFVKNLQIQLADIEKMGKIGYVDGMTQIIMNGLKQIDMYKRPIHCTDLKREIMYVREENRWDCDDEKEKLQKAIGMIHDENFKVLYSLVGNGIDAENPNIERNLSMIRECNGGLSEEIREKNRGKLIHNLSKSVYLDKIT